MQQEISMLVENREVVGIAAGVSVDGKGEWKGSAGALCQEKADAFSDSTITRIASISKPMTAVAIMQLVESNKLDLDAPVQQYLPEYPQKQKGQVTVRQLLNHTSGLSQYQDKSEVENRIHNSSLKEAMMIFQDRPLLFEPGSNYFYTSYGYVVLGRVIEEVSAMSYEEYMRKNIWEKSGMKNTGVEEVDVEYDHKACLYSAGKRKPKPARQNDLSNRVPGGGVYSTVDDLLKFGKALLTGKLIQQESFEQMLEQPDIEFDGNAYGLGWYFYAPKPADYRVIGHGGGQTGCTSQLMIVPASGTVVVVLSNTSGKYPEIVTLSSKLIQHSEKSH